MPGYDIHAGAGKSTSSPGSSIAISALWMICLPPVPAIT
jgi:hypothetical protein